MRRSRSATTAAIDPVRDYITLTKPRVTVLLLLTTVTTMYVRGPSLSLILLTMLGGYLAAGGAGAINHYIDRDRDAHGPHRDRPLVYGRIAPTASIFGISLGCAFFELLALPSTRSRPRSRSPACSVMSSSTPSG